MRYRFGSRTNIVAAAIFAATHALLGCTARPVKPNLYAGDAESRISGIVQTATSDTDDRLPVLVGMLDDDDPAVRLFAAEGLRQKTGQDFGYRCFDDTKTRAAAVDRWRRYVESADLAMSAESAGK